MRTRRGARGGEWGQGGTGDEAGEEAALRAVARELRRLQRPAYCSAATALAVRPPAHLGRSGWAGGPAGVAAGLLSLAHGLGRALVLVPPPHAAPRPGFGAGCEAGDVEGELDLRGDCPGDGPAGCAADLEAALLRVPARYRARGAAWWRGAVARFVSESQGAEAGAAAAWP